MSFEERFQVNLKFTEFSVKSSVDNKLVAYTRKNDDVLNIVIKSLNIFALLYMCSVEIFFFPLIKNAIFFSRAQ